MKKLLPFLFICATGCATAPAAPAMPELDKILKGDILSPNHIITVQEKKEIKAAIVAGEKEIKKKEAENKSLSFWAFWGRIGAAVLFIFILLAVIKKTLF